MEKEKSKAIYGKIMLFCGLFLFSFLYSPSVFAGEVPICDIENPEVPCQVNSNVFDSFIGNYSSARAFFNSSDYNVLEYVVDDITYVSVTSLEGHNTNSIAWTFGRTPIIWTSPEPYNVSFGLFGSFGQVNIEKQNNFQFFGPLSPVITDDFSAFFSIEYPRMFGPVYHADYRMESALQTNVPLRVKLHYDEMSLYEDNIKAFVIKMTDENYDVIDTANPYLSQKNLASRNQFDILEWDNLPLLSEQTNYFRLVLAYSDNINISPKTITSINFSLRGLSPGSVDYQYGQVPILPPLDADGGTTMSTGSVLGDLIRDLFVPSSYFLNSKLLEFYQIRELKYPEFDDLKNAFSNGIALLSSSEPPTLVLSNLYGSNDIQIMNVVPLSPYISTFKSWISAFLYFYLAVFAYRSIHAYFHPGQLKMPF